MSVVVRMEMPKKCYQCDIRLRCSPFLTKAGQVKPMCEGCRIICSLPEGHGRLVDAELVKEILKPVDSISHYEPEWTWGELHEINCVAIDNAPTIVPADAERSET